MNPILRNSSYQSRLKAHLAGYKSACLMGVPDGLWTNGLPYPHILPPDSGDLNLLPCYREAIRGYLMDHPEIQLHRFFHHLNSSQAMCLNLLWPLLHSAEGCDALRQVLGIKGGIDIERSGFEVIPEPAEGTSFDCVVRSDAGESVFMELKLSEQSFGTALNDERHRAKLATVYAPRLAGRIPPRWLEPEEFFGRYQMLRNLSHACTDADSVVFLLPRKNERLVYEVLEWLEELSQFAAPRVRLLFLEDFACQLRVRLGASCTLQDHYREFARKYII